MIWIRWCWGVFMICSSDDNIDQISNSQVMTVMVPSCMWIVVAWLALWLNRFSHHHLVFDKVQPERKVGVWKTTRKTKRKWILYNLPDVPLHPQNTHKIFYQKLHQIRRLQFDFLKSSCKTFVLAKWNLFSTVIHPIHPVSFYTQCIRHPSADGFISQWCYESWQGSDGWPDFPRLSFTLRSLRDCQASNDDESQSN